MHTQKFKKKFKRQNSVINNVSKVKTITDTSTFWSHRNAATLNFSNKWAIVQDQWPIPGYK